MYSHTLCFSLYSIDKIMFFFLGFEIPINIATTKLNVNTFIETCHNTLNKFAEYHLHIACKHLNVNAYLYMDTISSIHMKSRFRLNVHIVYNNVFVMAYFPSVLLLMQNFTIKSSSNVYKRSTSILSRRIFSPSD